MNCTLFQILIPRIYLRKAVYKNVLKSGQLSQLELSYVVFTLSKVTQKQCSLKLNHHYALFCHCKTGVLYSPGYLFSLDVCQPGFFDSLGFLKAQVTKIHSSVDYLYSTQYASKNCLCSSLFIFFQNLTKGEAMHKFEDIIVIKPVYNCLSSLQKSESLKSIILVFHVKKLNNQCELDVRLFAFKFQVFGILFNFFQFFPLKLVYF